LIKLDSYLTEATFIVLTYSTALLPIPHDLSSLSFTD
jgi:hypothetical protein